VGACFDVTVLAWHKYATLLLLLPHFSQDTNASNIFGTKVAGKNKTHFMLDTYFL
jgi:hypothetical protein